MTPKILLVGDPRLCPQVAYVMDWQDFETVEQLTDAAKYRDYKIVVCAFKKKSKRLVKVKDKALDIIYLDDICRELDAEERRTPASLDPSIKEVVPLRQRIIDRIKRGEVGLAIVRRLKRHVVLRNFKIINKLPIESLRLSEMFIKVLYSRPTNIDCDQLLVNSVVDQGQNLNGCCPGWVPVFGNLAAADLSAVYNSCRARIIKLSAMNRSYCFCNPQLCQIERVSTPIETLPTVLKTPLMPRRLTFSFDRSCNLRCIMCRANYYTADVTTQKALNELVEALLSSGWLQQIPYVTLAGDGEVFYSNAYRHLLTNLQRKQICILSNGTLFDRTQWENIKAKYEKIDVVISVDAASVATYQKIRGGNFAKLMENLIFIGELRERGAIGYFTLHFVVQKDNYHEMADFVRLAKRLHVDKINFIRLNKWGSFTKREYWQKSLLLKNGCLTRDFYNYLQDSIFKDDIVNLTAFQSYLVNSAKRYGKRGKTSVRRTDDKERK